MKEFMEQSIREKVNIKEYQGAAKLPLLYKGNYHLYLAQVQEVDFLLAEPLSEQNLVILRKQQRQLEYMTGIRCALYLKKLNYYAKDKLLEEGIPFVWENKQIYLPFLGVVLQKQTERALQSCQQISFLTQRLLLTALYENWQEINVTKAAEKLGVTKMSITRAFDELEIMNIPLLQKKSRVRLFSCVGTKKEVWNMIAPYMRNPLIFQYELEEDIDNLEILSGMSALCAYSMLEDNAYPTYAITKKDLNRLQLHKKKCVPHGEIPRCVIQELGYMMPFGEKKSVDPLTVSLLLEGQEENEPRVGIAIDKMLEEYVWCGE